MSRRNIFHCSTPRQIPTRKTLRCTTTQAKINTPTCPRLMRRRSSKPRRASPPFLPSIERQSISCLDLTPQKPRPNQSCFAGPVPTDHLSSRSQFKFWISPTKRYTSWLRRKPSPSSSKAEAGFLKPKMILEHCLKRSSRADTMTLLNVRLCASVYNSRLVGNGVRLSQSSRTNARKTRKWTRVRTGNI
jgi:hypothetical protein